MMNYFTPVLGDFELVSTPEIAKQEKFQGGTDRYIGSSVINNNVQLYYDNCREDIYALGVIIYDILYKNDMYSYVDSKSVK